MTNVQQEVEKWKDIPGFEGFYQASDFGQVRSIDRKVKKWDGFRFSKGRLLKLRTEKTGYISVSFNKKGAVKRLLVHRIIMLTFKGAPPVGKKNVLHADDVKSNNYLSNLRYGSQSENIKDCISKGRYVCNSKGKGVPNLGTRKKVIAIDINGIYVTFDSIKLASLALKCSASTISYALAGKRQKALGFIWKYAA